MVTNLKEEGRVKCQQYWPDSGYKKFGPFKVKLDNQQAYSDYTIRHLSVEVKNQTCLLFMHVLL